MHEGQVGGRGENKTQAVQAGKQLCVSETIIPRGSRHSLNLVYRGMGTGGGLRTSPDVRMAGREFVDLRDIYPAPVPRTDAGCCRPGFCGAGAYAPGSWRDNRI